MSIYYENEPKYCGLKGFGPAHRNGFHYRTTLFDAESDSENNSYNRKKSMTANWDMAQKNGY